MIKFNLLKKHIDKKEMLLYSYTQNKCYGKCGTSTQFKDRYNNELFVGDVVRVTFDDNTFSFITVVIEGQLQSMLKTLIYG
jgi:hypothetical protein